VPTDESIDRSARLLAALTYPLGPIGGAFALWRGRDAPLVRFHAWQAILLWLFVGAAIAGFRLIPLLGLGLEWGFALGGAALAVFLAGAAYRAHWPVIPLLGDVALEWAGLRRRRSEAD